MQLGRARTSGLGVPLLLLARWVGWVAPVSPTHGVWLVVARPSVALGAHVCAVSWATWLLFTGVPAWCMVSRVRCPGPLGSCSPVCPLGALSCVCGVLGHLAPVHRCAHSVLCVVCAVSWATWLLFTGVPARCVVLRVRCPGPLGSSSPVCPLVVLRRVCGVLGHLALVHRCVGSVFCVVCVVSWATWLLFTCVPARWAVSRVRCPGPLGSRSPVCWLGALCCVCGVLGHLAPVHLCARSVGCVACAVSWASCSPVCWLGGLCCVCGVLGHLAPVHRCVGSVCCVACAVSWATWLLFTGVLARCTVLRAQCPGPLGSCPPVCWLGALCCVCGVLGPLAPVHLCACSVCCVACAVSWATWLLFTGVPARCVVSTVRCPGPLGSCSPVWSPAALRCVCGGVLGLLAPVQRCACSVCCVARVRCPRPLGSCSPVCSLRALRCVCAVSLATWLLFTVVPARCVVSRVRCPGPLGSCSPVCSLGALCCVCGVLGPLAPDFRGYSVPGAQSSGGTVFWGHSVPGAQCSGGTVFRGHSVPEAQCSSEGTVFRGHSVPRAQCSGGTVFQGHSGPGALFRGHSVPGAQCSGGTVFRGRSVPGAQCSGGTVFQRHSVPGAQCSGGTVFWGYSVPPRAQCSGGTVFRGHSVPGAQCSGGTVFRGHSVPGAQCSGGTVFRGYRVPGAQYSSEATVFLFVFHKSSLRQPVLQWAISPKQEE